MQDAEQDRQVDVERLEAKGKTTDVRALRISTIQESWPQLAEAFEAKQRADAAKKAGKPAKSAAMPDKATAGMAARMQAFLQPRSVNAPAKPATGLCTVSTYVLRLTDALLLLLGEDLDHVTYQCCSFCMGHVGAHRFIQECPYAPALRRIISGLMR